MRVLSIREPFASLIASGDKKIETRSFKTNYRGELFIHASGKKIDKSIVDNTFINNMIIDRKMQFGKIICRVKLVDCVYMDQEFINSIKDTKEYQLGLYKEGRYAWILDNVELIEPIIAKGRLNIWNYQGDYKIINKK